LVPPGEDEESIDIFKDGAVVANCSGQSGNANPDPCVSMRTLLGSGDIEITVLSSTASEWNFGVAEPLSCDDLADSAARALCVLYCDTLDCEGAPPISSSCDKVAANFLKQTGQSPTCD
jgi:hypothetical protein